MTPLLDKVIALALWHALKKKESVDVWFTRMVHERMKGRRLSDPYPGLPSVHLTDADVEVVEEEWTLSRLVKFARLHDRKNPKRSDKPLILFDGSSGQVYLIDGGTRINQWESSGDEGPHSVLIVKRRK